MDPVTFDRFRELVYAQSGITLQPGKEVLVSARVAKRMRSLGLSDVRHYLDHVLADDSGAEIVHLLDAISTNVTSFFREPAHFSFIEEQMRGWMAAGQSRFRFWSAACSTGEEPYTLAMTLANVADGRPLDTKILATDISTRVLQQAQQAVYQRASIEPVPDLMRRRFLQPQPLATGETGYQVAEELRRLVTFRRLNLSVAPYPMSGPMDTILCRNVMIYFDQTVRQRLVDEFMRLLKPGGYLLVGHAESLTGLRGDFQTVKPSVYRKP